MTASTSIAQREILLGSPRRAMIPVLILVAAMAATAIVRLALMAPAQLFGRRVVQHGAGSWRKWGAVLQWSLGLRRAAPAAGPGS